MDRIEEIREEIKGIVGGRVNPRHKDRFHLPIGKALFVVADGRIVTVKTADGYIGFHK